VTASDADGSAEEAGADVATDAATDAGNDGGDAEPDAPDAATRCATLDCNDAIDCTVDDCDETLGCTHTPSNDRCDDHKACSGTETCNAATGCEPGTPVACNDSNRCTFDHCAEPAGRCVHDDVSTSVELLLNGHFEYGVNLGWRQLPVGLIWKNAELAHAGDWYGRLGGRANFGMSLHQYVEVPASTSELTVSGLYFVLPGEGAPALSSYFRVQIRHGLTGVHYQRALSLGSTESTSEWVPFSLTTSEPHAGQVLEIGVTSQNGVGDLTLFFVDSLSLRAKVCPTE
jgi:hypothetical protein